MLLPRYLCSCGETEDLICLGERAEDGREVHVCPVCLDEFLHDPSSMVDRLEDDDEFEMTLDEVVRQYAAEGRLHALYD